MPNPPTVCQGDPEVSTLKVILANTYTPVVSQSNLALVWFPPNVVTVNQPKINNNLSIGFVIKNFGKEYSNHLKANSSPLYGIGATYNIEDLKIILISDLIYQDNENFLKFAMQTNLSLGINFILGGTYSKNYKDFSFGVKLDLKDWSMIYGNLNHDNPILGNPTSIEIKKYF